MDSEGTDPFGDSREDWERLSASDSVQNLHDELPASAERLGLLLAESMRAADRGARAHTRPVTRARTRRRVRHRRVRAPMD